MSEIPCLPARVSKEQGSEAGGEPMHAKPVRVCTQSAPPVQRKGTVATPGARRNGGQLRMSDGNRRAAAAGWELELGENRRERK